MIAQFVECQICEQNVVSLVNGKNDGRIFFSELSVLTLIECPFHPYVATVASNVSILPQVHVASYSETHTHH